MAPTYEEVLIESSEQLRTWLAAHHDDTAGIWVVTWKKGHGPYVPYAEIVDEALCFGWIDSRPRSVDEHRSARLLSPRKPGSGWSKVNKDKIRRLEAEGRLADPGRRAVVAAQRDGSWTALDVVETLAEPDDLRAALDHDPAARRFWDGFPRSTRRAILEWISNAKTAATRTARIERTVWDAAQNIRANQWRQPKGSAKST